MITVTKYKAEHLIYILKTGLLEECIRPLLSEELAKGMEKVEGTVTVLEDEKPILIGGYRLYYPGRAEGWLIIGKPKPTSYPKMVRVIKRYMDINPVRRLEMTVSHEFSHGERWAKLLGFTLECPLLKAFTPDGKNASLYVRVRS